MVWFTDPQPEPLYVCGPTGSGKSSLIRQICARLNYPVFEITAHDRLETSDLIGHLTVQGGDMGFSDGPLTAAMRKGALLLIDEIDLASPATLTGINTVLDGAPLVIPETKEMVVPARGFRLAVTANTNGSGDSTGVYRGTQTQNAAFTDRFTCIRADYLPKDAELALLSATYPTLPARLASDMVAFAGEVRTAFTNGFSETPDSSMPVSDTTLSTRTLLRWARLTLRYEPLSAQWITPLIYALDRALAFKTTPATRAFLHELAQRVFSLTVAATPNN